MKKSNIIKSTIISDDRAFEICLPRSAVCCGYNLLLVKQVGACPAVSRSLRPAKRGGLQSDVGVKLP